MSRIIFAVISVIIKKMQIILNEPKSKRTSSLWNNSPCSLQYASVSSSIGKTDRFRIGSIYYKDPVDKSKKVYNEFEKPEILVN